MRRLPKCFHKTIFIDVLKGEEISHTRVSKEFFSVCGRENSATLMNFLFEQWAPF